MQVVVHYGGLYGAQEARCSTQEAPTVVTDVSFHLLGGMQFDMFLRFLCLDVVAVQEGNSKVAWTFAKEFCNGFG